MNYVESKKRQELPLLAVRPLVDSEKQTESLWAVQDSLLEPRKKNPGNPGGQVIHGMADTKLHWVWKAMKSRCLNPRSKDFHNYGGRGIRLWRTWAESFSAFLADMGQPQSGETLERIDNNGHYEPSNCRWATRDQQANNTRSNLLFTHNGETRTLAQWAKRLGKNYWTLHHRYRRGLSTVEILA